MEKKPSSERKEVLRRLLEALKAKGVEYGSRNRVVAEKTGYSEKTVGNLLAENSSTAFTDRFLKSVCSAFGISMFWVVTGRDSSSNHSTKMPEGPGFADKLLDSLSEQELIDIKRKTEYEMSKIRADMTRMSITLEEYAGTVTNLTQEQAEMLDPKEFHKIVEMNVKFKSLMIEQITKILPTLYLEEVERIHRYALKVFNTHNLDEPEL